MDEKKFKLACDQILTKGMTPPPPRMVDYKTYKVLESMVEDGLITGLPFSEYATDKTIVEFRKRMDETS